MTIKTKKKTEDLYGILSPRQYLIFTALCILLFYPPFFRGLFFQKELLMTHILTFSLFAIWMITKIRTDSFQLIDDWSDLLALGFLFMYGISMFYGVNTQLAIAEFLKYANYIAIFFMVKKFTTEYPQTKTGIQNILLLSGAVVSIIGIGSAIGTFSYNGAFVGGRISSTFQYPNTLAAYVFALFILAIGLLQTTQDSKGKYFYGALANLYFFTLVPTFSRGMWLLAPLIYFLYLILLPKTNKLKALYYSSITALPALFISILFIRDIERTSEVGLWLMVIGAMVLTMALLYGSRNRNDIMEKILSKKFFMAGTAVILALVMTGILALNATQPLVLSNMTSEQDTSKGLAREVKNLFKNTEYRLEVEAKVKNPQEKAYGGRIDIYSINEKGESQLLANKSLLEDEKVVLPFATVDTTEVVSIQFLNLYTETEAVFDQAKIYDAITGENVQNLKLSYKYIPERIIQRISSISAGDESMAVRFDYYGDVWKILKDYPLFGAGGGAWATLYFKYQSYPYWSTQVHNFFLQLWLEVGTIGLLIYGAFLGNIVVHLWKTLRKSEDDTLNTMHLSIAMGAGTILTHSAMDFDLSLGAMAILLWTLLALMPQDTALRERKAFRAKGWTYTAGALAVMMALGSFSLYTAQTSAKTGVEAINRSDGATAIAAFERATKLDPFSAVYLIDLSTIYRMTSKDQETLLKANELVEKAVALEPYNTKFLQRAADLSIGAGDYEKALGYLGQMVDVQPMNTDTYLYQTQGYLQAIHKIFEGQNNQGLEKVVTRIPALKARVEKAAEASLKPMKASTELGLNLQKLDYVYDQGENRKELDKLKDIVAYNRLQLDLDRNHMPDGSWIANSKEGKVAVQQNPDSISLTNDGTDHGILWMDDLTLQANEKYTLAIDYASTLKNGNLDVYVYDFSDEKGQVIEKLENLRESADFITEKITFTAPQGAVPKKQRIAIFHRGKDPGVANIRLVTLMKAEE